MHAEEDDTTLSRPALGRLIRPFEYRHARAIGSVRLAAGGFQLGIGLVLVSLGRQAETDQDRRKCFRFGGLFLVLAVLNLLGGSLDMVVDSKSPHAGM